jgi:hypothetical protein
MHTSIGGRVDIQETKTSLPKPLNILIKVLIRNKIESK